MAKKAKPEMRCFLSCDAVTRDEQSAKTSIYSLFDTIWADEFPGAFRPFFLFLKLTGPEIRGEISLQGIGTDGEGFMPVKSVPLIPKAGSSGAEIMFRIGLMPLSGPGVVRFLLKLDGRKIGWPCEIVVKKKGKGKGKAKK
ncbi:MAG: hypothetical protein EXS05_20705 [Planctomycetaceae bacterium]|nr:hypothetical protein [Planctomycetaceae bacterium]